jgi:hypothetical protein
LSAKIAHATNGQRTIGPELASSTVRRSLRRAAGLVLFADIAAHLVNHALGLIAINMAVVWFSTSAPEQ